MRVVGGVLTTGNIAANCQRWTDMPAGWKSEGMVTLTLVSNGTPRHGEIEGRPHLIVPAVFVRSQVLRNNLGEVFLPPEEITDAWADAWNGIPVLLGPHPSHMGQQISGRNPDLWSSRRVGVIFGARAEVESNGNRRLVGEVWLDEGRIGKVDGLDRVVHAVRSGRLVELSTGFTTRIERAFGTHDGRSYEAVMHPLVPDHLVVSEEQTGACSVQDGCGLGANSEIQDARKNMSKKRENWFQAAMRRVSEVLGATPEQALEVEREVEVHAWKLQLAEHLENATDNDRSSALGDALQTALGIDPGQVIVVDVFSEEPRRVVYFVADEDGPSPPGALFFQSKYKELEGGQFKFGERVMVRRMTRYDPVVKEEEGGVGNTEGSTEEVPPEGGETAATQEGSAAETAHTEETDMSDTQQGQEGVAALAEQISAMAAAVKTLTEEFATIKAANATEAEEAKAAREALNTKITQIEKATAPAVAEQERERSTMVEALIAKAEFTAEELESEPMERLRKLHRAVTGEVAAGRSAPVTHSKTEQAEQFAEPVPYWLVKKDQQAASA
jgi:hypothetical protein